METNVLIYDPHGGRSATTSSTGKSSAEIRRVSAITFSKTLIFVIGLLYLEKRVSYRRLRKEFGLDDETLDDVCHELIVKRLAVDEGGQGLAFVGAALFETGDAPLPAFAPAAAPLALPSVSSAPVAPAAIAAAPPDAERRQLTVMFCDPGGIDRALHRDGPRRFARCHRRFVSVPAPEDRYPRLQMTAQQERNATLDAIIAWLIETAERAPVLMAWEDLHWADPTTLETLGMLIEQAPTAAMLVVATYRPELTPPWPQRSHMTPITLNRLERSEVETMVGHLSGGRPLPGEVVDHIVAKADGVPLYVEELTKAILGSGVLEVRGDAYVLTGALAQLHIPETLQDSLMARLDRAPRLREVAQLGAVLGREFAYDMISALAGIE